MSKSNDKQNRTRGVIPSSNTELPNPLTSSNSPVENLNKNKNRETIQIESKQNQLY